MIPSTVPRQLPGCSPDLTIPRIWIFGHNANFLDLPNPPQRYESATNAINTWLRANNHSRHRNCELAVHIPLPPLWIINIRWMAENQPLCETRMPHLPSRKDSR